MVDFFNTKVKNIVPNGKVVLVCDSSLQILGQFFEKNQENCTINVPQIDWLISRQKKNWTFILFLIPFKVLVIPNILTENEKNSTTSSPSKWRPKSTIFQHFRAADRSEMAQVQNSFYEIEPTGGAQEYEHQRIGQLNFHWGQMLLYCELYHVKDSIFSNSLEKIMNE